MGPWKLAVAGVGCRQGAAPEDEAALQKFLAVFPRVGLRLPSRLHMPLDSFSPNAEGTGLASGLAGFPLMVISSWMSPGYYLT